jgi:hypothetical protein
MSPAAMDGPKQEFLLASMRVASLNLRSWASEVDMIGIALRGGLIGLDDACLHLDDLGILRWLSNDNAGAS